MGELSMFEDLEVWTQVIITSHQTRLHNPEENCLIGWDLSMFISARGINCHDGNGCDLQFQSLL